MLLRAFLLFSLLLIAFLLFPLLLFSLLLIPFLLLPLLLFSLLLIAFLLLPLLLFSLLLIAFLLLPLLLIALLMLTFLLLSLLLIALLLVALFLLALLAIALLLLRGLREPCLRRNHDQAKAKQKHGRQSGLSCCGCDYREESGLARQTFRHSRSLGFNGVAVYEGFRKSSRGDRSRDTLHNHLASLVERILWDNVKIRKDWVKKWSTISTRSNIPTHAKTRLEWAVSGPSFH